MFTSKQRANLRSLASKETSVMQVGKNGVGESLVDSLSDALDARELIKLTVLETAPEGVRAVGEELAAALKAEFVCAIGKKVVLYRRSNREGVKHVEY